MVFAFVAIATTSVLACQVPVFRYALERWQADRYELIVIHEGPLSQGDTLRLEKLKDITNNSRSMANLDVQSVELKAIRNEMLNQLWQENHQTGEPLMVVLYPRGAQDLPTRLAQVSAFTDEAIAKVIDSPVRQQLVSKLLAGESAVWIFVPTGRQEEDAAALKRLQEHVELNQSQLELPPQDEIEADEFFNPDTAIELRIGFSIVTLDRQDPREQFLLKSLVASEDDLVTLDQPLAFPVLGRGRVLYALVGKGIFRDTIDAASRFIVGPCSCQVKEQNPGFDLLLAVDWEEKLGSSKLSKPLPPTSAEPILLQIPPGKKPR